MSSSTEAVSLKRTPLDSLHRELGAKRIDFGGGEMPVQYQTGGSRGTDTPPGPAPAPAP